MRLWLKVVASNGQLASQGIDANWHSVSGGGVDLDSDRYRQMLDQYDKKREADVSACRRKENAVACIDVARQAEFADGDFWDGVHTTPSGSRRVGELMCRGLLTWAPDFKGGGVR